MELAAVLAAGLRPDSRSFMKLSGQRAPDRVILLAMAVDALNLLVWAKTKDAQHKRNKPESIASKLRGQPEAEREADSFRSGAEFRVAWEQAVRRYR